MPKKKQQFQPNYSISNRIASTLMQIEAIKTVFSQRPISVQMLRQLRESARLTTTHYSTMIEGNRFTQQEVNAVLQQAQHFPGRERDEAEVQGYYAALQQVETLARESGVITERQIRLIHGLVQGGGRLTVAASPYRDGQNVIKDAATGRIVYLPPEAADVPWLMAALVDWLGSGTDTQLPVPILAAIAHYQFATIHPYYDGNGRTARLLANLVLYQGSYHLKGIYSLEEYYARDLQAYYAALSIGPSHNYYEGRAGADISSWLAYFLNGMLDSFQKVQARALQTASAGQGDLSGLLRTLDGRQRKALTLFHEKELISSRDVAVLFGFRPRTARDLCQRWVRAGFLEIADPARKSRTYRLHSRFAAAGAGRI